MSAAKPLPSRYVWLKAMSALDAALSDASARAAGGARPSLGEAAASAFAKFKEAYNKPLTTVMYMAGAAMAPSINKAAQQDKDAVEKLVRRRGSEPACAPRPRSRALCARAAAAPRRGGRGRHRRVLMLRGRHLTREQAGAALSLLPSCRNRRRSFG